MEVTRRWRSVSVRGIPSTALGMVVVTGISNPTARAETRGDSAGVEEKVVRPSPEASICRDRGEGPSEPTG
jgi:hypothetical protein